MYMNRKEALLKYQEEVSPYLYESMKALEDNFVKEQDKLKNNLYEKLLWLFSNNEDNKQIQYIQISLLRSQMDADVFVLLLTIHDKTYFLDKSSIMQKIDISSLFIPLKEVRTKLYQFMECYQRKIEKFDADQIIRETAMTFYKKMAEWCRIIFRDFDYWCRENKISQWKRLIVKWGGFQETSETVFLIDISSKNQQEFLVYNEKNNINQWNLENVYQSWESVHFTDITIEKKNLLFIMLRNCKMKRCQWENCLIHGASFRGANLKQVIFAGCDLSSSDFRGVTFDHVQFIQCNLASADFSENQIESVQFTGSQMKDAIFSRDSLSCKGLDANQIQQIRMKEEPYVF